MKRPDVEALLQRINAYVERSPMAVACELLVDCADMIECLSAENTALAVQLREWRLK
ncbi:MAG: hypothetical protein Q8P46_15625 [Hyphomicrobiales bacterium]|nr:hypothetical protein [Hyphomicrobiales bacterium]